MRFQLSAHHLRSSFQRLRDPQVQVWVMAGFSVLLVLIGHLRAWNASSEGKNDSRSSASRLLLAGARVEWSEDFAATPRQASRPALFLSADALPQRKASAAIAPVLDLRPAMQAAASQPWQALERQLRQQLAHAGAPPAPLKIHLSWNGDRRGNAALVSRLLTTIKSRTAAGIVIGNGSRSGDGEIELLSDFSLTEGPVEITLIGPPGRATPSQLAALAEVLVHLEALSGHPLIPAPALGTLGYQLAL